MDSRRHQQGIYFGNGSRHASAGVLLAPARRFDRNNPELIDRPDVDLEDVQAELRVLETANRRFGGHYLMIHYADRLVRATGLKELRVLDLGTGVADIPRALIAWGRGRGLVITVTAIDLNPKVLAFARQACRDWPEIALEQHDVLALPFEPNTFDLVTCSLALHHFERDDAVRLMARVREIARVGYVLNDLRRNWFSVLMTEVLARTVIKDE